MDDNTMYLLYPDGSFRSITCHGCDPQPVPEGATQITHAQYLELLAAWEAAEEQRRAEQQAAEEAQQLADYTVLRQLGIPHEMAARMSGYTGPELNP